MSVPLQVCPPLSFLHSLDAEKIPQAFGTGDTWAVIAIAFVAGMLGGLAHRLAADKNDKTPLLWYLVLGGASAVAALFVISRDDPYKFVGACVVAGFAGKAVLSALQARLEASIAKAEARKSRQGAKKAINIGKQAIAEARRVASERADENGQIARRLVEKRHLPVKDVLRELPGAFSSLPEKLEMDSNAIETTLRTHEEAKLAALDGFEAKLDGLEEALDLKGSS
jgi:hypothetical protein